MIKVMTGDHSMLDIEEVEVLLDTMFSETFYSYILSVTEEARNPSLVVYELELVDGDVVDIEITEFGIKLYDTSADLSYYLIPESYENAEEELTDKVWEMIVAWVGCEGV